MIPRDTDTIYRQAGTYSHRDDLKNTLLCIKTPKIIWTEGTLWQIELISATESNHHHLSDRGRSKISPRLAKSIDKENIRAKYPIDKNQQFPHKKYLNNYKWMFSLMCNSHKDTQRIQKKNEE